MATTSVLAQADMLQDGDLMHNYTVAKITMDCNFIPKLIPKQRIVQVATIY